MLSKTLLLTASTAAQEWNYDLNGSDWADLDIADNECGGANQSPIDLISKDAKQNAFMKTYKNKIWSWKDDDTKGIYPNGKEISWTFDGKTIQLDNVIVDGENARLGFQSMLGESVFGADTQWRASHMQMRAGSEHTIDGERQDLELQVYHTPENVEDGDFTAAAFGILFSVENYTAELSNAEQRIIDIFFESM